MWKIIRSIVGETRSKSFSVSQNSVKISCNITIYFQTINLEIDWLIISTMWTNWYSLNNQWFPNFPKARSLLEKKKNWGRMKFQYIWKTILLKYHEMECWKQNPDQFWTKRRKNTPSLSKEAIKSLVHFYTVQISSHKYPIIRFCFYHLYFFKIH